MSKPLKPVSQAGKGSGGNNSRRRRGVGTRRYVDTRLSPTVDAEIRSDLEALLVALKADPSRGRAEQFKATYLEREIYSKYLDPAKLSEEESRKQAAIKKWQLAELRNENTNVRLYLDTEASFPLHGGGSVSISEILEYARGTIAKVLGPFPDIETLYGTFTSGASTKFRRGAGAIERKFMDESHVTCEALPWFWFIQDQCEAWIEYARGGKTERLSRVQTVGGSMMFTVPKSIEIDRVSCKEPGLNMFLQKGIGQYLVQRLRSVLGQDLRDQTVNQRLAKEGSITGKLATLDLSSASDLISHQLVFDLLPGAWFTLLDDCRSRKTKIEGEWHELNMFSTMGNAFTFELETLIFWSLVNSVAYHCGARGTISVYGDDIICPSACAGLVARVFSFLGFKVNSKKSFWRGPFRESCGKHYFAGIDVTPVYIKEPVSDLPALIHFCNRFRLWSGLSGELDDRCYALWAKYRDLVPREYRGGRDLNSIEQLVTDESPSCRLSRVKKPYDVDLDGAYLHWLRAADGSANRLYVSVVRDPTGLKIEVGEPLITSAVTTDTSKYRKRKLSKAQKDTVATPSNYVDGWP